MLTEAITDKITQGSNAEAAVCDACGAYACMFDAWKTNICRQGCRCRDIGRRWVNNLLGVETETLADMQGGCCGLCS